MKASELVSKLNQLIAIDGDLEVDLFQDEADEQGELDGISTLIGKNDKPELFILCGPNTLDAFL